MSGANLGPVPTRLVFLTDLASIAVGEKVRFLGCVSNYAVPTATLTLNHRYPVSAAVTSALVDVGLLLNTVKSNEIQVGEWVNVIGYITQSPVGVNQGRRKPDNTAVGGAACVQAIVLWSAGAIKLGEYEQVLEERHEVERRLLQT